MNAPIPTANLQATAAQQKDERLWATFAHLGGFAGYIFPFGNLIAPLVIWQIKKDQSSYVAENAKESLNFQISMTLWLIVSAVLMLVLIGILTFFAILVFEIVMMIIAAVKASQGESYRYPLTFRFVK